MATFKTIIDLIVMGHTDLPSIVAAVGTAEINSQTRRLKKEFRARPDCDTVGYWLNPVELSTAVYWWVKQPFAEKQLKAFLETEGNLPEEYLESGSFTNNSVRAEGQLQLLRSILQDLSRKPAKVKSDNPEETKTDKEVILDDLRINLEVYESRDRANVMQVDKHDGKVVLDRETLEVKNHRRIHKKHTNEFASCILASVKLKFGMPERSKANELAIRRFVAQQMQQRGVREVDAARVTPYIVAAAFIPSDAEIGAAAWLNTRVAKNRLKAWTFGATA